MNPPDLNQLSAQTDRRWRVGKRAAEDWRELGVATKGELTGGRSFTRPQASSGTGTATLYLLERRSARRWRS
jgi:hypothetical protein